MCIRDSQWPPRSLGSAQASIADAHLVAAASSDAANRYGVFSALSDLTSVSVLSGLRRSRY
eukprot:7456302-Alexandrium_andersonii.AAC.1